MTCYSQHLETIKKKSDAILDENGQESVISTLRSVVPETQDVSGTEHSEVHGIPAEKIVVPETQGAEHVVATEHYNVCAIPAQKIIVPETQEGEEVSGKEQSDSSAIPKTEIVVPETQEGDEVSGKEHSDSRAIPETEIVGTETQGAEEEHTYIRAIPETPEVYKVEVTMAQGSFMPECVVKVARLPPELAKGIELHLNEILHFN